MGEHEEKIEIMRKYLADMTAAGNYHVKGNIPIKKIDNALQTFAQGMDRTTMLGFLDTTVFGSGKNGYILLMIRCIMWKQWRSLKSFGMMI